MDSLAALDLALRELRRRERRLSLNRPADAPHPVADAIETLEALRELIADNVRAVETRD